MRRTTSQNAFDASHGVPAAKKPTSQYRGVYFRRGQWWGQVSDLGIIHSAGPFTSELQAALEYDLLARKIKGVYAVCNFPEEKS